MSDISTLASWAEPSCKTCDTMKATIDKNKAAGIHQSKPAISESTSRTINAEQDNKTILGVVATFRAADLVDSAGAIKYRQPGATTPFLVQVTWAGSGWRILDITLQQVSK